MKVTDVKHTFVRCVFVNNAKSFEGTQRERSYSLTLYLVASREIESWASKDVYFSTSDNLVLHTNSKAVTSSVPN